VTTVTTASLDQLGDLTGDVIVVPLDVARRLAHETFAEVADSDIHNHHAMLSVAVSLGMRLASLLAALDAEEGER
jgi:hypothetical protein